ncbi:MAG: hypothetical protein ACM3X7_06905 [Solirubrobacterales bacterium]
MDRGHTLENLLSLGYYEKLFYIACMLKNKEEDTDEKITLNPFLKKR